MRGDINNDVNNNPNDISTCVCYTFYVGTFLIGFYNNKDDWLLKPFVALFWLSNLRISSESDLAAKLFPTNRFLFASLIA